MYIIKQNKNGNWILIKKGTKKATKTFSSKSEAIFYADEKNYDYDVERTITDNVSKAIKKKPKIFIPIIFCTLIIIIGIFALLYFTGNLDSIISKQTSEIEDNNSNSNGKDNDQSGNIDVIDEEYIVENIKYDDFQIHFLELGNKYTGDSCYIKAGDTDILIDAGSRGNSSSTLTEYVSKYCTDGKLEYVIATHGHQDHISGFAGNSDSKAKNFKGETVGRTGILYYFEVGTFIDFAYKGEGSSAVDNKIQKSSDYGSSIEYGKYLTAREYAISKGANYFTAKELWDNNNTNFELADNINMDILYNYYYFASSTDENNYSVCTMFNYNDHHFLLTGDLEKDGEEKLVNYYNQNLSHQDLPHCDLFKGGHHGSYTASNEVILNAITPDICCVCCCAGATEYTPNVDTQFPSQEFINRIAKYTSRVYVTTMFDEVKKTNVSMNGNIIVSCNGIKVGLNASNNLIKLKDTRWFNTVVYVDSKGYNVSGKAKEDFYTALTEGTTARKRRTWPLDGVE